MMRVVIAGLVAGAALFMWGFVSWTQLTWHRRTIHDVTGETIFVSSLQAHLPRTTSTSGIETPKTGTYIIPGMQETTFRAKLAVAKTDEERKQIEDEHKLETEAWNDRHREGPLVMIFYRHSGTEPMAAQTLAAGLGIAMLCGFFAALGVYISLPGRPNFFLRVGLVLAMGFFTVLMTYFTEWNYLYRPDDWTLVMCADNLIGSLVVGIVVAIIVRPGPAPKAA
jgi:hypothetical protein